MKRIFFQMVACGAVLLSLAPVRAAAAEVKVFGDFAVGKRFVRVVSEVSCRKFGPNGTKKAAIPDGVPHYAVGQNVRLSIGQKGQLNAAGFFMIFLPGASSATANRYASNAGLWNAMVVKNARKQPEEVYLTFFKRQGAVTFEVHYKLE